MLEASVYFVLEGGDGMVLQNKLGITNSVELAREEERISKKKALNLFDTYCTREVSCRFFCAISCDTQIFI